MDSSDKSFGFHQQDHKQQNSNGKNAHGNETRGKEFVHGCMSSYDNGLPEDSAIYKILHNTFRQPRNPFLPPVDYTRKPRQTGRKGRKGPEEGPDDEPYFGIISEKEKRYLDLLQTYNKKWKYCDIPDEEKPLYDEFMKLAQEITSQEEGFMAQYVARYMKSTEEWQKNYLKRRGEIDSSSSSHNSSSHN